MTTKAEVDEFLDGLSKFIESETNKQMQGNAELVKDLKRKVRDDTMKMLRSVDETLETVLPVSDYPVGTTSHISLGTTAAMVGVTVAVLTLGVMQMRLQGKTQKEAKEATATACFSDEIIAQIIGLTLVQTLGEHPGSTYSSKNIPKDEFFDLINELESDLRKMIAKFRAAGNKD